MRILEIIKRLGISGLGTGIFILSYADSLKTKAEVVEYNRLKAAGDFKAAEKIENIWNNRNTVLDIKFHTWKNLKQEETSVANQVSALNKKLANKEFTSYEREEDILFMKAHIEKKVNELIVQTEDVQQELNNLGAYYIKQSDMPGIKESDMLDPLLALIEQYKNFVSVLSPEQLVALCNIIGYYTIFSTLSSICIILLGDSIINKLDLESRFPKLARFIQIRARVTKAYLKVHVFLLFITILVYMCINIYMFYIAF
jgi:hypothetical protein